MLTNLMPILHALLTVSIVVIYSKQISFKDGIIEEQRRYIEFLEEERKCKWSMIV